MNAAACEAPLAMPSPTILPLRVGMCAGALPGSHGNGVRHVALLLDAL